MGPIVDVTEQKRLNDAREAHIPWKKWGPYLSERQWGTVREDYSDDGNAWDYFTHDQARSRAYRWGEDGLGGLCDDKQRLCFALALWNERDPILKERLFGLTNSEANHGEDVKEYYFYIDSTPTHSYMKYLYKYPQREYPYRDLIDTNRRTIAGTSSSTSCSIPAPSTTTGTSTCSWSTRRRGRKTSSSASPCTIAGLKRPGFVSCRHSGSATPGRGAGISRSLRCAKRDLASFRPHTRSLASTGCSAMEPRSCSSPRMRAMPAVSGASPTRRLTSRMRSTSTSSRAAARRSTPPRSGPRRRPTICSTCPPAEARPSASVWPPRQVADAFGGFEDIFKSRIADADEFYDRISPESLNEDERRVHRQALAGMLWSKQYYYFDLDRWLQEHKSHPLMESARPGVRNTRMVSHAERRRDLHAGQVGVSLVCGLGPGVSHDCAVAGGFRFRQGPAPADAAQSLCPPQWADSRLRVELQRCESAGARLGHALPLQDGADPRPGGPSFPGTIVSGVDAEFQLVGQSEGS